MVLTTLFCGGKVVISQSKEVNGILNEIIDHKINFAFMVPSGFKALIHSAKEKGHINHALKWFFIGGDRFDKQLLLDFNQLFGIYPIGGMGMTETLFQSSCAPNDIKKLGSAGKAMPGVSLKLIDENGNSLAPMQNGELLVKSPSLMQGYWQNEKATNSVLKDG